MINILDMGGVCLNRKIIIIFVLMLLISSLSVTGNFKKSDDIDKKRPKAQKSLSPNGGCGCQPTARAERTDGEG